jgi:selenocysteine lyase/cysteine desulfurase
MDRPLARLVGADTQVPCFDGRPQRYVNLDYAASTPVMAEVWEAVQELVPWYSSVHRGTGHMSQVATDAFESARGDVARFVGAPGDEVVFARNTTEAINVLAASLPAGTRVLSSPVEHHANMLRARPSPRRGAVRASIGIGTTTADVDSLVHALYAIAQSGPRARYEHGAGHDEYRPLALRAAA